MKQSVRKVVRALILLDIGFSMYALVDPNETEKRYMEAIAAHPSQTGLELALILLKQFDFPVQVKRAYMEDLLGIKTLVYRADTPSDILFQINRSKEIMRSIASVNQEDRRYCLLLGLPFVFEYIEQLSFIEQLTVLHKLLEHPAPHLLSEILDLLYLDSRNNKRVPNHLKFIFLNTVLTDLDAPDATAELLGLFFRTDISVAAAKSYAEQIIAYPKRNYLQAFVSEIARQFMDDELQQLIFAFLNASFEELPPALLKEAQHLYAFFEQVDALMHRRISSYLVWMSSPETMADFLKLTSCLNGQSKGLLRHEIEVDEQSVIPMMMMADEAAKQVGKHEYAFFSQRLLDSHGYTAYQRCLFQTSSKLASDVCEASESLKKR